MTAGALGFGFKIGHWTDPSGSTGCTVIIPPRENVTSCEVRGSSPGSREIEQLRTDLRLTEVHGILLTGGSAFGLAAADGVMSWLAERDIGYRTPVATIPIVPTAVIFDLARAGDVAPPGPDAGRVACDSASTDPIETGRVGAGAGARVGKWAGIEHAVPGGLGIGHAEQEGLAVSALAVVNAIGDVLDVDGSVLAGTTAKGAVYRGRPASPAPSLNTVLVCAVTSATLDKRDVHWLAARAADGVTSTVRPAHTRYDGDIAFFSAAPGAEANVDVLGYLATIAVQRAVRAAVV
ncbi:MAG: P1 family peptidase [Actinomycetota bacterium]|nr:P1 family peptidase [Actinomycetota bacterium]